MIRKAMRLYAVTDRTWLGNQSLVGQIEEALLGGITCLQLREKNLSEEDFITLAREVKPLCSKYKVPLIINDNINVALACQADGVHIGQKDVSIKEARRRLGRGVIIGVSAQSVQLALEAQTHGADYLGVGAVFGTSTKKDANPLAHDIVRDICKAVDIPVVAIGGVNENNLIELKGIGLDGVAVVSAIFSKENITKSTQSLFKLTEEIL